MIFCRGCGKQIHESAISCPNCGAPQIQEINAMPVSQVDNGVWQSVVAIMMSLLVFIGVVDTGKIGSDW